MATFKFRPDRNSDHLDHPTNGQRATWAELALAVFTKQCGGNGDPLVDIQDLISDLGHLADRIASDSNMEEADYESIIDSGLERWREER